MAANDIPFGSLEETHWPLAIYRIDTEAKLLEKQLRALEDGPWDIWNRDHSKLEKDIQDLKDKRRGEFFRYHAHRPQIAIPPFGSSQDEFDSSPMPSSQGSTSSAGIFSSQGSQIPAQDAGRLIPFNKLGRERSAQLGEWETPIHSRAIEGLEDYFSKDEDSTLPASSQVSSNGLDDIDGLTSRIPRCFMKQSTQDMPHEDKKRLQHLLDNMAAQAIPENEQEERCWLYEGVEADRGGTDKVEISFKWKDECFPGMKKRRHLRTQVGTWRMIVEGTMTLEQQYGWIYEGWHLSHLCGNWRCINPAHHTIEPAEINWDRKACHHGYRPPHTCEHSPGCLFRNKDGKPREIKALKSQVGPPKKYHQQKLGSAYGFKFTNLKPTTGTAKWMDTRSRRRKSEKGFGKDRARKLKQQRIDFEKQNTTPLPGELPFDPEAMTWFPLSSVNSKASTRHINARFRSHASLSGVGLEQSQDSETPSSASPNGVTEHDHSAWLSDYIPYQT